MQTQNIYEHKTEQFTPKTITPVIQRFKLEEKTINIIKSMKPKFGFNGLGEVVFRRTYSRDNENWNDVVIRVIEGVMSIRKDHFYKQSLNWDDNKWQKFAREMAISMFNMEWLPPGRGLWMMGTEFAYKRGSMALNNCFSENTRFWTSQGLKSFEDYKDGDKVIVRGKNKWMPATVHSFGMQKLWELKVQCKGKTQSIFTTANHRWIVGNNINITKELENGWKLYTTTKMGVEKNDEEDYWKVVSVTETKRTEEVWCVTEPEYEEFTLEGGIVTKNCAATKTLQDLVHSAEWTMDALMNGVGCIPSDSNILTENGIKPIKDIKIGEKVWSFNTKTNNKELKTVTKLHNPIVTQKENIKFICKYGSITTSKTHPIMVYDKVNEQWTYKLGKDIRRGDILHKYSLKKIEKDQVIDIQDQLDIDENWKDITVEDNNNYFTGEKSMYCSHNCGFDTSWRGEVSRPNKEDTELFVINDSREGWVHSLIKIMCAYIDSPKYGKNKFPIFDYSLIREAGKPIKGFGGLASGPAPLEKLHKRIESYLDAFCDGYIEVKSVKKPYTHTRLIADIFNAIGACVVAGNVRRSAEIALGDVEDRTFINLKNYSENPERAEIGWMSNNSVVLQPYDNYEDFSYIPEMAKRIHDNGEPGMINLYNMQKFGRYGKEMKDRANLVNPCVTDDTWITTKNGAIQVKDLIGKSFEAMVDGKLYECNKGFFSTGKKPVFKLVTNEGFELRATANHKIMTADNKWVELKDLIEGDKIRVHKHSVRSMAGYNKKFPKGWLIGSLYGDGTFDYRLKYAILNYRGKTGSKMMNIAMKYLDLYNMDCRLRCNEYVQIQLISKDLFTLAQQYISQERNLTNEVEKQDQSFIQGFLRGWFDANGSIQENKKKSVSICLVCCESDDLKKAQRMALRLGIYSEISKEKLIIPRSSIKRYNEMVGFLEPIKSQKLKEIISSYKRFFYDTRYEATIASIESDGIHEVYDATVEGVHAFDANGIYVHNCGEIALENMELCVSGDTRILTKQGYPKICDCVGKQVDIWNGERWSTVTPFKTASDKTLYRVGMTDGSYLDVTDKHKWSVKNKITGVYEEVKTFDLNVGMELEMTELSAENFENMGKPRKDAYIIGYCIGCTDGDSTEINKHFFTMDTESVYNFVAGWIDSGTQTEEGYIILSHVYSQLKDMQLLLRRIGINYCFIKEEFRLYSLTIPSFECKKLASYCKKNILKQFGERKVNPQYIKSIETLYGKHDTFCFTEPIAHKGVFNNVLTHQCNLSDLFPPRCENKERFFQAVKYATFYASTVSLLPTHRPETNAVIARNRRIGVGISGIAQWASGCVPDGWGPMNYTKMTTFLREGYKIVRAENKKLAEEAGVPASVRVTTIKPSGSISLLAGVTPGIHYPVSRYAIRRMRIGKDSPLVQPLIDAGIKHEDDTYSDNTMVFEFVIDHGAVRPCKDVSPWEQFCLMAMVQRTYSDNCVSCTIYFDKEKETPENIEEMLAMFIPVLKSVSMLPHAGHGYAQAPYEPIDEETYMRRRNEYKLPDFNKVKGNVPEGSKYCNGDKCVYIPQKKKRKREV